MSEAQAGYSGTPLVRKVGVKAGHQVVLCAAPDGWAIPDLPAGTTTTTIAEPPPAAPAAAAPAAAASAASASAAAVMQVDVVVAFCRTPVDLRVAVEGFADAIHPAGALWIAWPRRAAGHRSDITENLIREVALPVGLVDVKVAALDTDWSGLKLVWRKEMR